MTIGTDEAAETILYTDKTGNDLAGVTRGFEGVAKSWAAGTKLARYFTAYDHDTFRDNITDLDERLNNIPAPQDASLTEKGIVQLSSDTGSSSQTEAATPKAVNDARLAAATDATTKANAVQTVLDNHVNANAATSEPHGMRVRSGKLEYYNGSVWATVSSGIDLSTANIDYYVNAATGNDSNDGLSTGQSFKTINKALSLVPAVFVNDITINVAAGTYTENLIISNKFGTGILKILGPSSGSPVVISGLITVERSTLSNIELRYLTINQGASATPLLVNYVKAISLFALTMTATSTQPGLYTTYSVVNVFNCTISSKAYGIRASTLSKVYSNSMLGSGNNIGIYADSAGEIVKYGTQPSGSTSEQISNGGLIRS
ncbi:tail fiber protein [Paenibacillus sp. FSL K6-1318]|uniref:phage tail protein n=1 Tax=Paenibacillus sp. FSL K6-1318 TaxID=2975291 RepID=UPI0030EE15FD